MVEKSLLYDNDTHISQMKVRDTRSSVTTTIAAVTTIGMCMFFDLE